VGWGGGGGQSETYDGETQRPRPVLITDSLRGESGYFGDLTLRYSLYLFLLFFIF